MISNNPVFKILVPTANSAVLAAGSAASALADGQMGIFDNETNLSIDGTDLNQARNFYIGVMKGTGTSQVLNTSAGPYIQRANIKGYNLRCYTPAQNQIIDISNFGCIDCNGTYGLKFELRNGQIYADFGFNGAFKVFTVKPNCCSSCDEVPQHIKCADLVTDLRNQINLDEDQMLVAQVYNPVGGAVMNDAAITTWKNLQTVPGTYDNAGKCLGLRVEALADVLYSYCSININYFKPRGTSLLVSAIYNGTECNNPLTVTVNQELIFAEGLGYDLKQLEYMAGGWEGKPGPYRVSSAYGLAFEGFPTAVDGNGVYVQLELEYDHESESSFHKFQAGLRTTIAIPCANATARTSICTFLDRFTAGKFRPALAANADCPACGTVNQSEDNTAATNGLG